MVGLTGEIKLRFRDGLVWTVGLTCEIKLRFQNSLRLARCRLVPESLSANHNTVLPNMATAQGVDK